MPDRPFTFAFMRFFVVAVVVSTTQLLGCANRFVHEEPYPAPRPLASGACESFEVVAAQPWNRSGILLTNGSYHLSIVHTSQSASGKHQAWQDASCQATPEQGWSNARCGFLSEKFTRNFTRSPHIRTFALACSVGPDVENAKAIGDGIAMRVDKADELMCFANDVAFMYCNNSGSVTIQVCRDADK